VNGVHEVLSRTGECLYRGRDVEMACEIYGAAPAGTRLVCMGAESTACTNDEPIPYALPEVDEAVPYALTPAGYAASDLFVVDTTDVGSLRRRCPELFTRSTTSHGGHGRTAS
jgi:hypothetical protein